MVGEKIHPDWNLEHFLFQVVVNLSAAAETLAVLFRGAYDGGRPFARSLPDTLDIQTGKMVVVGEFEMLDNGVLVAQISFKRCVRGYA